MEKKRIIKKNLKMKQKKQQWDVKINKNQNVKKTKILLIRKSIIIM